MTSDEQLVAAAKQILSEFAQKPPAERFAYWVRLGIVDKEGRLTTRYGGVADPETGSLDEAEANIVAPLDRLLWVLRSSDSICLDAPTARRLTGAPELDGLVRLITEAVQRGLAVRWSDAGEPGPLHPVAYKDKEVGTRLTELGKARARELEAIYDRSAPLEALPR